MNGQRQSLDEGQAVFTIPKPAWADEIDVGGNGAGALITHLWTAPTIATGGFFAGTVDSPVEVQALQVDELAVDDSTIIYKAGRPVLCMTEADLQLSPTEARRLAAAILEACDHLDSATEDRLS